MATNLYRLKSGAGETLPGRELKNVLETINDAFAKLKTIRAAMIQEKDGTVGDATDFVTPAAVFGFVGSDGATLSSAVAMAAFAEIDAFVGNGGPSLEQCCARFKQ